MAEENDLKNQKNGSESKKENEETDFKKEIEKLKAELEKIKKERDEFLNGWQRERADFLNYQKDEEKRFQEVIRFSNERIIKSLIPILDSLELAIYSLTDTKKEEIKDNGYLKGLSLIYSQLQDLLEKEGVTIINPLRGDEIDPRYHEAVSETEDSGVPSKRIVRVLEKGYLLNGKLLRPARVIVAK